MKNKTLTIILSATLIACIDVSIYQYNTTATLKNSLAELTNTKNELTAEIENKTKELKNITSETEEMNNTISELTAKMDNLNLLAEEMQSEIKSLEEAQNGTISQSDKETFDSIWAELEKENPDLFVSPEPSTTQQGNYESVGTPDSGQFTNPNYTVGESGSDGLADNVTVY